MSDGRVTDTGLRELARAIDRLPDAVTAALKDVARTSAGRIAAHAKSLLRAQTHGTGATADAIAVVEDAAHKQYVVYSPGTADRPANLPLWLEVGTIHMSARPYLRPAGAAETDHYTTNMTTTAERTAQKVLG